MSANPLAPTTARLELHPLGRSLHVTRGTPLQDALFEVGVEFPCGGHGRCRGCRIRRLQGDLDVTPADRDRFTDTELSEGWRLACHARAQGDLTLELGQWQHHVLTDDEPLEFSPRCGFGIAIDLGTTTIVAQLIDLSTGNVRGVRTALNAQAKYGADVMTRLAYAHRPGGRAHLTQIIRQQLAGLLQQLMAEQASGSDDPALLEIVLVGNTAMHHLFGGLGIESLACAPFEPQQTDALHFRARDLGWTLPGSPSIRFLPCIGGFVGSDLLAGILSAGLMDSDDLSALVDLGTNGEIAVGHRHLVLCTSTAAGPAFEGARIHHGMRADHGAIAGVRLQDGQCHCRILGGGPPRGICGSGLVDAVAAGLQLGRILPSGRLHPSLPWELSPGLHLQQADIRELQLAKGAIAAGLLRLLELLDAHLDQVTQIHLAGAFGNYVDRTSAQRIGLLPVSAWRSQAAGNSALRGARLALLRPHSEHPEDDPFDQARARIRHVSLGDDARFGEIFAETMAFPGPALPFSDCPAVHNPTPS